MTGDISQTIGKIYDAVDDPRVWPDVIGNIAALLMSEAGGLSFENLPSGSSVINVSHGFEPGLTADYNAYYHSVNLLLQRAKRLFAPGKVIAGQDVCSEIAFADSEYYNDCLKKWGFFYVIGGVVAMNSSSAGLIQFLRARKHGPFSEEEKSLLHSLNPHLNRALRLHDAAVTLRAGTAAMDQISTAIVLLNGDQRVVYANRSATEVFKRGDGIKLENGFLTAVVPAIRQKLRSLIASNRIAEANADCPTPPTVDSLSVERSSRARPYSVVVSAIRKSFWTAFEGQPALAVFILDPEKEVQFHSRRLQHLHGFTSMEAKLASILITGEDLSWAYEALHITRNTGRAHLRSMFSKLNVTRQSELVSVILRGSIL